LAGGPIALNGTRLTATINVWILWTDRDAGQHFLRGLMATLPHHAEIDQLVMTVPVASFRGYVDWLNHIVGDAAEKIRIVDESTAAAIVKIAYNLMSEVRDEILLDASHSSDEVVKEAAEQIRLMRDG